MRNEFATNSRDAPSGDERATASVPITAPPPGRVSTMIVRLVLSPTSCAKSRIMTSATEPAAKGTMMRTVFSGGHCAAAGALNKARLERTALMARQPFTRGPVRPEVRPTVGLGHARPIQIENEGRRRNDLTVISITSIWAVCPVPSLQAFREISGKFRWIFMTLVGRRCQDLLANRAFNSVRGDPCCLCGRQPCLCIARAIVPLKGVTVNQVALGGNRTRLLPETKDR